jgi:hypothetical protein
MLPDLSLSYMDIERNPFHILKHLICEKVEGWGIDTVFGIKPINDRRYRTYRSAAPMFQHTRMENDA